nr:adenylate kinase isoenzyme 1-like isoform X4 [Symphalangus syndactylus]
MTEAGTLVTLSQARRGQNLGGVGRDRPKSCWPDGSLQVQAARGGQGSEAPGEGHSQVPPIIFVMGGPGCGKGTQCKNMVTKYGFCHVGLGQLLRQEAQRSTQRGWQICDIMLQGLLMPAGIILDMVSDNMLSCLESRGFLIDGFPWELKQAMEFEHIRFRSRYLLWLAEHGRIPILKEKACETQNRRESEGPACPQVPPTPLATRAPQYSPRQPSLSRQTKQKPPNRTKWKKK